MQRQSNYGHWLKCFLCNAKYYVLWKIIYILVSSSWCLICMWTIVVKGKPDTRLDAWANWGPHLCLICIWNSVVKGKLGNHLGAWTRQDAFSEALAFRAYVQHLRQEPQRNSTTKKKKKRSFIIGHKYTLLNFNSS